MSTIYCKYHPKIAARWSCEHCNLELCGGCATKDTVRNTANCPVCKSQLEAADASNFIEPFWKRIPKFFSYPSNSQSLIFAGLIGLFISFAPFGGFLSWGLMILFSLAFLRYALLVLEHTADGRDTPPEVSINILTSGYLMPLKMIATYIVFGFAVVQAANFLGAGGAIFVSLFILACLPASTMMIATTDSFFQAINPAALINIIQAIGKPYWLLYLFLILLSACQAAIVSIIGMADTFLLWPVQNTIGLYFTLIMYNMMGYVIFQYHEPLGYSVRLEVDQNYDGGRKSKSKQTKPQIIHPVVQEAELLVKEGNLQEAINRLKTAVTGSNVKLEVHAYYHQLLFNAKQVDALTAHAKEYINVLLYEKKTTEAAKLLINCYKLKTTVHPNNPDNYYVLAHTLKDMRAFKECMALINNFHSKFPGHADIPKLYLLGARVLCEQLHNDAMAAKLLKFLKSKYPQHELSAEIEQLHNFVQTMTKAG